MLLFKIDGDAVDLDRAVDADDDVFCVADYLGGDEVGMLGVNLDADLGGGDLEALG